MNNVTIMENGLKQAFNEEEYPLIVRYLRNISFTIEDYIRDSILFLKKTLNDNPYIMSRSKLRNNFIRSLYKGHSFFAAKRNNPVRDPHRQDEMPKNTPSRLVWTHCSADVSWLQDSTSCGGHSRPEGGHSRVSGLVRASLRRETGRMILEQLQDDGQQ